jgi:hypothetical protein
MGEWGYTFLTSSQDDADLHAPAAAGWVMNPVRTPSKENNPCPCSESNPPTVQPTFISVLVELCEVKKNKSDFYVSNQIRFTEVLCANLKFVDLYDENEANHSSSHNLHHD